MSDGEEEKTEWGSWGASAGGILGKGTVVTRCSPVAICCGLSWKSVAVCGAPSLGITADGDLYAWGAEPMFDVKKIFVSDVNSHFNMLFADFFSKLFKRMDYIGAVSLDEWIGILNDQFREYSLTFQTPNMEFNKKAGRFVELHIHDVDGNVIVWRGTRRSSDIIFEITNMAMIKQITDSKAERKTPKQEMLVHFHKTFSRCLRGVKNPSVLDFDFEDALKGI